MKCISTAEFHVVTASRNCSLVGVPFFLSLFQFNFSLPPLAATHCQLDVSVNTLNVIVA